MAKSRKTRLAMMAGASLLAAAGGVAAAGAADFDAAAYPAVVDAPVHDGTIVAGDHGDEKGQPAAKRWALVAVAAGALAGIVRLIGAKKVLRAVSNGAAVTGRAAAKAGANAAKAVGKAAGSPLLFVGIASGLALFALLGAGLYDIEWIAGLAVGATMAVIALYGAMKVRGLFSPKPVRIRKETNRVNRN